MKKIMLTLIEGMLKPVMGKKTSQSFFNAIYFIALRGMNFRNDNMDQNGEVYLMRKLSARYRKDETLVLFAAGANVGKYTRRLVENFSQHRYVIHSFEPVTGTFQLLRQNIAEAANVTLHHYGLGASDTQVPVYSDHPSSPLASVYKRDLEHVHVAMNEQAEKITLRTLQSVCSEEGISHIHFLKLDTEGSEYDILESSSSMLNEKRIDFIQFEFGSTCMDRKFYFKDLYQLLHEHYRVYRLLKNGLYEYASYHSDYEIFSLATYVAVSRNIRDFIQS